MAVRTAEVAKALNLSERRVQQLTKDGMPQLGRGSFELGPCMAWYIRYLQKALESRATPGEDGAYLGLSAERARLAKEQADKTALDNATRRGELVEMAVVAEEWSRYFQAFRERFIGFPVKVAAELAALTGGDADTIRGRLDDEVDEWLAAFHRQDGSAADDSPHARRARGRSPAAAAAVNGQRVGRPKAPTEPRKQRRTRPMADG